jgi:(+)-neomenthol dehydrogenase
MTRLAVITGGNKGVGLQVRRQLALKGVAVILTTWDKKRGKYTSKLKKKQRPLDARGKTLPFLVIYK